MNERLRILVVEDNPADIDFIHEMLPQAGPLNLQVESVARLSEAITRLKRKDIDLVLLDLGLPDSQGLQTFHKLQKAEPDIPVIVLTGNDDHELAIAAMRDGAQDYLVKGQIGGSLLVRTARYAVERKQTERRLQMFQFATDQADDAVFWMDRHAGFYYVNDQACRSLGYTREELMRLRLFDIDPAYPEERWEADWAQFHEKRIEVQRLESFHRRKDGVVFPIEVVGKHCWFGDTELHVAYVRDITGRKRAEEALRGSETALRTILESTDDGILAIDSKGEKIIKANRRFAEMWRVPQSLIDAGDNRALRNFVLKQLSDPDAFLKKLQSLDGTDAVAMDTLPFKDGRVFERYGFPMITNGVVTGRVWSFRDITERKRAEEALQESEARYRALFDKSADGILIADIETKTFKYANTAVCQILGYTENELRTMGVMDIHPKDARQNVIAEFEAQARGDKTKALDIPCLRKDGSVVYVDINGATITVDGRLCNVGFFHDITERKLAGEKLRLRESFLSAITENQPGLLWLKDTEGRFLMVNKAFATACGRGDPEQVHGLTDVDIWPKELAEKYRRDDQRVMSTGNASMVEEMIFIGNNRVWYETFKTPVRDDQGRVIGTTGYARDITERKRVETDLRESEARFRRLSDATFEAVVLHKSGVLLSANDQYFKMFGYTPDELLGKQALPLTVAPEAREYLMKQVESGSLEPYETIGLRKDGTRFPMEIRVREAEHEGQKIRVAAIRDITGRKQAEEALANERVLLRTLVDHLPMAVYLKDLEGRKTLANQMELDYVGATSEAEVLGKTDFDLFPPEQAAGYQAIDQEIIRTGQPLINREGIFTKPDGSIITLLGSVIPVRDVAGRVTGLAGINFDITERKQSEKRITDALNFNRTVLRASPMGIIVFKATGPCVSANEAIGQIIGGSREEVLKQNFRQLESWKNSGMLAAAEAALATQTERKLETQMLTTFGKKVWCFCRFAPFQYEGEHHLLLLISDITERKQAEEALRESKDYLEKIINSVGDPMFVKDRQHRLVLVNDAECRLAGRTREELLGKTDYDFFPKEQVAVFWQNDELVFETGQANVNEETITNAAGELRTIVTKKSRFLSPSGQAFIVGIIRDITERKQAEEAVAESRRMLQLVLDTIPVRVFWKDLEGRFVGCNRSFASDAGFDSPDALVGKDDYAMWWKDQADLYRADDHKVVASGVPKLYSEKSQITPAGEKRWLLTSKVPLRNLEGRVIGVLGAYEDITERKRVEEERSRLAAMLETTSDFAGYTDARTGQILYVNKGGRKMCGVGENEDVTRLKFTDVHPEWANKMLRDTIFPVATRDGFWFGECAFLHRDGHEIPVWMALLSHKSPAGEVLLFSTMSHDITERKQSEEEIARTAREWQTTFDATRDAIWILDSNHRILRTNKTAEKYFQRPCSGMLDKPCWEIVHGSTEPIPDCPFGRARKSGHRETMDLQIGPGWFEVIVDPILDDTGQFAGAVHIVSDITERKRAEEALRKSRTLYYSFVEQLPIGIFRKDREGRFILVNPEFCRFKGMKAEEFLGKTPREVAAMEAAKPGALGLATKYAASGAEHHEQIMQTGKPIDLVEEYIHADGGKQFLHVIKLPVVDHDGKIIGTQGIQFDITELKLAEERIREQAALLDAANDAIYVRSLDDAVTYWNNGAERLYGWTRAEALGRKIHDLIKYDRDAFETAQAALLAQGNWSGELKMTNKTGKAVTVFCRWTLLQDESGQPKEVLAINTDITERKQLEANFLRAQRMEGIGALAGGIAHDLNNILQPILMTAPFLRETTGDPESREMLNTVENCAQRGADIIKQLLTFARGEPSARVPLPVRHLLNEMSKLIHETFPKNIQLRINVPKDLWQVLGDATQIHQALMNLCVNARDAMPNGGTLTLTAENLTLDEAFAAMMPGAKPGPHVCVSVADTGTGIPPEHLDRIFDPFFTTKEIGKGTGLGLATVLGIARGHGGFVRVKSQTGKGTIFELYLPASPEAKAAVSSERETLPPRAGGELILVVDDEADVRGVVRRMLEKHGYRVLTAAEGSEAMDVFAQHQAGIRAVLTDMMMPNMDGPALVRTLRHLEPQLPILGMTGVGEKADIKDLETLDLLVLLTKPFNIAGLLDVLHQALAAPGKAKDKP